MVAANGLLISGSSTSILYVPSPTTSSVENSVCSLLLCFADSLERRPTIASADFSGMFRLAVAMRFAKAARRIGVVNFWRCEWDWEKKREFRARRSISISVETLMRLWGGRCVVGSGRRREFAESSRSGESERGRRVA